MRSETYGPLHRRGKPDDIEVLSRTVDASPACPVLKSIDKRYPRYPRSSVVSASNVAAQGAACVIIRRGRARPNAIGFSSWKKRDRIPAPSPPPPPNHLCRVAVYRAHHRAINYSERAVTTSCLQIFQRSLHTGCTRARARAIIALSYIARTVRALSAQSGSAE